MPSGGSPSLGVRRAPQGGVVWPPRLGLFPSRGCLPFSLSPCRLPSPVLWPLPLSSPGVSVLVSVRWPLQCRVAGVVAWRLGCGGGFCGGRHSGCPLWWCTPLTLCRGRRLLGLTRCGGCGSCGVWSRFLRRDLVGVCPWGCRPLGPAPWCGDVPWGPCGGSRMAG